MKSLNTRNNIFIKLSLILVLSASIYARDLSVGTDVVSRYIWRGFDYGESPSIQPAIEFSTGGFAIGFWGAYPTADPGTGVEEIDFYTYYSFDLEKAGSVSIGFTDYMYPTSKGFQFSNFNNYDDTSGDGPGSHYIELNTVYSGPESFPVYFSLNVFLYNVAENPFYFEVGYSTSISDVGLDIFVGVTPGDTGFYYGVDKFDFTNIGIKASKEIKVTDDFTLPIFSSVIINPSADDLFFIFGLSF